jgi:hypothetical protein
LNKFAINIIMEGKMMSRVGKYTEEKHTVIKRRDEILSGHVKKFVVKSSMLAPKADPDEQLLNQVKVMHSKKIVEIVNPNAVVAQHHTG